MQPSFKDHFSTVSQAYRAFRPVYPESLYAFLASLAPSPGIAWDCGTGSGQAAIALAGYFRRVIATDASLAQIEQAPPLPNVEYIVAPAEQTPIEAGTVDLVCVAQALHWFDIDTFFEEADRVLKPGGILAVWSYNLIHIEPDVDVLVKRFARETVGPFWPPERALIDASYRSIDFPYRAVATPAFTMEAAWGLDALLAYVGTWSAMQRYREQMQRDPVSELARALRPFWGKEKKRVRWTMPLYVRRRD